MVFFVQITFAQSATISGTVTELGSGEPLPGVSVIIDGASTGGVTDFDGKYSIDADNSKDKPH